MGGTDESSRPFFLDILDTEPQRAAKMFYHWVCGLFAAAPPREYRRLPEEKRDDAIHDIIVHCMRDNFRVLRLYTDRGRPFAAWFYFVARNKLLDAAMADSNRQREIPAARNDGSLIYDSMTDIQVASTENRVHLKELIEKVESCILQLDRHCQLLLRLSGDEFRPREIVRILRLQPDKAPRISEDLRTCRARLRKLLQKEGISDLIGNL